MPLRALRSFRVGIAAVILLAALPCLAAEVAVLKNGFSIRHERREVVGNVTRLYVNADGSSYVDVPSEEIEHFEAAPDLPSTATQRSSSGLRVPETPPAFARGANNGVPRSPLGYSNPKGREGAAFQPRVDLDELVTSASGRYRLDPDLVNSVIKAESGFNVRAVSPKGAQGLMQLMPGTASGLGVQNAFDARANVEGGTKYLRELLERYNFDLVKALAAYNAGPQRVEQFGGVPPYYETRAYVARIVKDFNKKKIAQQKTAAARSSTKSPVHSSTKASAQDQPAKTRTNSVASAASSQSN